MYLRARWHVSILHPVRARRSTLRLQYAPAWRRTLVTPLLQDEEAGIPAIIEVFPHCQCLGVQTEHLASQVQVSERSCLHHITLITDRWWANLA
jgi:hypothetical protein